LVQGDPFEVALSSFPAPLRAVWFDPVNNRYWSVPQVISPTASHTFTPPGPGDWVLRLTQAKPRLLVLTDIGGDPDDQQSLVRLLAYANEFDIEGLLATGRMGHGQDTMPHLIANIVDAYGQVVTNLAQHAQGWPTANSLREAIRVGLGEHGRVGEGLDSPASQHLIEVVDAEDPRPLWVVIWGGSRELHQALWRVRQSRTPAATQAFVAKLRVHAIADQDGHGAPIRAAHPDLLWIDNGAGLSQSRQVFRGQYQTGVLTQQGRDWVEANLRVDHGPLGAQYPRDGAGVPGMKEGDTPSWAYVLPHGLNDPEQPTWGGWGGRFQALTGQTYVGAQDAVEGVGFGGANERYTVARWRPAFQNEFQARLDWCRQPRALANHRPVAFVNQDGSRAVLSVTAEPGAVVELDARGSFDPDGDALAYAWAFYAEPGRAPDGIILSNATAAVASFLAPDRGSPQPLHCILGVTDNGDPPLTSLRRVTVTVTAASTNGGTTTGLVGHWELEEGVGLATADATPSQLTGTLLNGVQWTQGQTGSALAFDGVDDRVDLGNPVPLRLTGALTVAAWVWIESFSGNGRLISKQGGGGNRGWSLNLESGGYASFQIARDAHNLFFVNSRPLPVRQWIHLAGTFEPGVALRIYVDGLPDRAVTASVPAAQHNSGLNVALGDRPVGGTPFRGRLDEVRIYDRALSATEVVALGPTRFSGATHADGHVTLVWTGQGQLQSASIVTGPYTNRTPAPTPPYTIPIWTEDNRFFRIRATP